MRCNWHKEDAVTRATIDTINRFDDVFNRHDVDGIMALMTEDCAFEDVAPAPDGQRLEGMQREAAEKFEEAMQGTGG